MFLAKRTLEDIKTNGYELDFSTVFNKSLDNYKKTALISGLGMLLLSILLALVVVVILVGIVGVSLLSKDSQNFMDVSQFELGQMAVYWLTITLFTSLFFPMNAGFIKLAQDAAKGVPLGFGTLFGFYIHKNTGKLITTGVFIGGLSNLLSTLLNYAGWSFLGVITSLFISFFTILVIPLIIFDNKSPLEAIEGSIQIVSKQLLIILGLTVVSGIFAALGIFGLCIGIFFTLPFVYSYYYILYAEILGDPSEAEEIQPSQPTEM